MKHWDAALIIIFCIFVLLAYPGVNPVNFGTPSKGTVNTNTSASGWFSSPTFSTSNISQGSASESATPSSISISSGNAAYAYQPYEEYIELSNWGNKAVNITGWQLKNGKDARAYNYGSGLQRFSADLAIIPQATLKLAASGNSVDQDIVLQPGDRAIVTTGKVGVTSPYRVTSFKENICTGYIENSDDYAFNPPLQASCPRPGLEAGLTNLEPACRTFVEGLSSCRTPDLTERDQAGKDCKNCVNKTPVSSQCKAFITTHFTYQGCLAFHGSDKNFSDTRTWRIYLGRSWEMWAENYESIELFDTKGNLMSAQSY